MIAEDAIDEEKVYGELISELEAGTLSLPTLPEVAVKVRNIVNNPSASAADMSEIIMTDPALSTKLVKIANSPLFRGQKVIETVQMAVARLGINMIRNLVTSLMMKQLFNAESPKLNQKMRDMWEHNSRVAAISHLLASSYTSVNSDEAMLAGLIHNIGSLPILMRADSDPGLAGNMATLDKLIDDLSCRIGKKILEAWLFPQQLIDVAAEYQDLSRIKPGEPEMVDIVQVALLQSYMDTDHPWAEVDWDTVPAFEKLGLNSEIEEIEMEGQTEKIEAAQALLNSL